jgi:hypothetical protein
MLVLVMSLKLVAEVALMAMLGQWVLGLWVGRQRESNPFWRLLGWVCRPPRLCAAWVLHRLGRVPSEAAAAAGATVLVLLVWLAATAAKISMCLPAGAFACR